MEEISNKISENDAVFMGLLTACTHAGLVEKGFSCFNITNDKDLGVSPKVEHYGCEVDILSRGCANSTYQRNPN